jgi:hypothetical protein
MREQVTNTFSGGMNSDADKSVLGKNQYIYAENFRLFGDQPNTIGSLENVSGNTLLSNYIGNVIPTGYYEIGYCNIRDELYIFITQNTSVGQTGFSRIIRILFDSSGIPTSTNVVYDDQYSSDGSRLLWNNTAANRIKAVGRYESNTIKKIYFVDGYNPIRSINVATVSSTSPVNKFDIIPNFNVSSPQFSSFGSGKLTSGKIQYAYQMYDLNGGETLFSPNSSLISISETSGQTGSNKLFKGSDLGKDTGKGIRISIQPSSGFNRIRVISIKYNTLNSIPIISIIADQDISTNPSTTYFYDTGVSNLGGYTFEEIAIVGRNLFIASEIEEKNNYLFAANIVDENWDVNFDARAYRFVSSSATGSFTSGHAAIFDTGSWGTNNQYTINSNFKINGITDVPEKADALNPYNDISLDNTSGGRSDVSFTFPYLYNFKYQVDGTTLGGAGINVSYKFIQKEFIISDTGTVYNEDYCYNTDYSNINIELQYLGYQRDEVYRFGIVFFDNKGRQSNVKWIGDIRFPYYGESYTPVSGDVGPSNFHPSFAYGGKTYGRALGINFKIDATSLVSQGAVQYKIVRAERKLIGDRNILAQGLTPTLFKYNDGTGYSFKGYTIPYTGTSTLVTLSTIKDPTMLEFLSPEINFNKDLTYSTNDTLEYIGRTNDPHQWSNFGNVSVTINTLPSDTDYSHTIKYEGMSDAVTLTSDSRFNRITPITSNLILGVPTKSINTFFSDGTNMDGVAYKVSNFTESSGSSFPGIGDASHFSPGGTKLIVKTTNTLIDFSANTWQVYYCNYKRGVFNSQYGGNSYTARLSTIYNDCAFNFYMTTNSTYINGLDIYGGDTYIGMFDYLRNIVTGDIPTNRRSQLIMYFPVETSIDLRYRQDDCFSKTVDTSTHDRVLMQELAGTYTSILVSGVNISYNQKTNLYVYNTVYSQENSTISMFTKSDVLPSGNVIHDNRVVVSDLKIDSELVDSWTIFKADNFLDVDSKYGGITTLFHKDNYLYFWQPKAFGVLSVAQRSLMSDNNQGQLVIGTGGVLDRYDYITTSEGCSTRFSVVEGLKGLYWFDRNNCGIYRYSGNEGVKSLSITKGVSTTIRSSIPSNLESISGYDKVYNELLFTLPGTSNTFVFNEIFDSFNGIYTYYPNSLIKPNGSPYYISIKRNSQDIPYVHTPFSNRGSFFGVVNPSKIKLLINDAYNETKVFDGIHYESTSKALLNGTYHVDQIYDTFNTIRCYDDYQNSGIQTIYTSGPTQNITRHEREFKLNLPRNIVKISSLSNPDILNNTNLDATRLFKERMRDKYLIIDLCYNNTVPLSTFNYVFNVPYIITNYRISKR